MSTLFVVNIVIEIVCSVLCLVFVVCILVGEGTKNKLNRVFITVLLSNAALMLSDALAFFSIGKTYPAIFFPLNFIGNFLCFQFSYVVIICFSNYIYHYFSAKARISRIWAHTVLGICGFAIILTFLSLLNDMYFIIDENNIYHRQNMYWLSQILGMAGMLVNSIVIIKYRRHLNRMEKLALASYIILPVIAITIQMLVYGFVSVYIASTTTIVLIYVGIQAQQAKQLKDKELELTRARIDVMLTQIQPHFLYNALVVIRQLCRIDPKLAEETVVEFSDYLRGNLDSLTENKLIPFEQELHHVETYLNIEKKRFGDKVKIEYEIKAKDFMLPVLTLQPIVENAVRYGITKKEHGGTIEIKTEETENSFLITVTDDGIGFDVSKKPQDTERTHIGLENTRSRLAAMCSGTLEIQSEPGKGTTAIIRVPK